MTTIIDAELEWGIKSVEGIFAVSQSIDAFKADRALALANNSKFLQSMENQLATIANRQVAPENAGVWFTVRLPRGTIEFDTPIKKRNNVNWVGIGTDATVLMFKGSSGTAVSIDGSLPAPPASYASVSTATNAIDASTWAESNTITDARLTIADLSIKTPEGSTDTAKGVVITHAGRSFKMLDNVQIRNFGDSGLTLGPPVSGGGLSSVSDCRFAEVEIVSCGKRVLGGTGLKRNPAASAQAASDTLAAITFENLKIEGCGQDIATGRGGIDWDGPLGAGIWFTGMTRIQNNFGGAEAFIKGCDTVSFDNLYVESDNVASVSFPSRHGVVFENCQAALVGKARFGRGGPVPAPGSRAIILKGSDLWMGVHPTISDSYGGPATGTNAGLGEIELQDANGKSSFIFRPTAITQFPLRVNQTGNGTDMINEWPNGSFDGSTTQPSGVTGRNFTVTRPTLGPLGTYNVTFKRALSPNPLSNYTVIVSAVGATAVMRAVVETKTSTGFTIKTFSTGTTLANASNISFIVQR
jgi:hypothetical protein